MLVSRHLHLCKHTILFTIYEPPRYLEHHNIQDIDGAAKLWIKFQRNSEKCWKVSLLLYLDIFTLQRDWLLLLSVAFIFLLHQWKTEWKSASDLQLWRSPFNLYKTTSKRQYNQSLQESTQGIKHQNLEYPKRKAKVKQQPKSTNKSLTDSENC